MYFMLFEHLFFLCNLAFAKAQELTNGILIFFKY